MESQDLLIHTQYQTTITYLKQSLKQLFLLLNQMLMHHLQLKLKSHWFPISMFTAIQTITTEVIMEVTMANITDTMEVDIIVMDIILTATTQMVITVGIMEVIMVVVITEILTAVTVMEVVVIMGAVAITCLEALSLCLSYSLF